MGATLLPAAPVARATTLAIQDGTLVPSIDQPANGLGARPASSTAFKSRARLPRPANSPRLRPRRQPAHPTRRAMSNNQPQITYIGGPTALLEWGGLRLLTDPTFDAPGAEYTTGPITLHKTQSPRRTPESIGRIDAVLLSHDHHFDNLDHTGRALLPSATQVLTTADGAARLGGNATGLQPWQSIEIPAPDGRVLRIVATPARHGPEGGDRGPVIGFVLSWTDDPDNAVYISGDTVWYEGVQEVANRFHIQTAVLFLGAARVAIAGPSALTMTAEDAITAARAFPDAAIVPLHFEGWQHFSETRTQVEEAFAAANLSNRLHWPSK